MRYYVKGGNFLDKDRLEAFNGLITCSVKSLQKLKQKGMLPYGLGSTHTLCIRRLYEKRDGITKTELARLCLVDKAQISRIICDLTEKGYVCEKNEKRANYRSKLILTEDGVKVAEGINEIVLRINTFVSGDIPEENIAIFYDTFTKICDNLKKAEEMV